jgi:SAM-dependent methyltransferase
VPFYSHEEHYAGLVIGQLPPDARSALDVGCGDGRFTKQLAQASLNRVVGLDPAEHVIPTDGDSGVHWINADFLAHDFGEERFDFIMAMASIHHMPFTSALERMRDLLRPGGRLAILGLYRQATLTDRLFDIAATPVNTYFALRRTTSPTPAPKVPAETTLAQIRHLASATVPGAQIKRLLLWRYVLTWSAPATI